MSQGTAESIDFSRIYEEVTKAKSVQDAVEILQRRYDANFVYHMAQIPDKGIDAPFVKATYPPAWIGHYIVQGYVNIDPVVVQGFQRQFPFDWTQLEVTQDALTIFEEAVKFGLGGSGYSIPVLDNQGRRALFSVNAQLAGDPWQLYLAENQTAFDEFAHVIHSQAIAEVFAEEKDQPRLTPREIEVLQWSAHGKESPMIAGIIGVGVHTVRAYIKSARFKLDAATVSHAVTKAARLRLISLEPPGKSLSGPKDKTVPQHPDTPSKSNS